MVAHKGHKVVHISQIHRLDLAEGHLQTAIGELRKLRKPVNLLPCGIIHSHGGDVLFGVTVCQGQLYIQFRPVSEGHGKAHVGDRRNAAVVFQISFHVRERFGQSLGGVLLIGLHTGIDRAIGTAVEMLLRSGTVVQRIDEQGIQLRLEFVFKGIVAQLRIGQHGIDIHRGDELIALVVKEMQHGTQLTAHFHGLNSGKAEYHSCSIGIELGAAEGAVGVSGVAVFGTGGSDGILQLGAAVGAAAFKPKSGISPEPSRVSRPVTVFSVQEMFSPTVPL